MIQRVLTALAALSLVLPLLFMGGLKGMSVIVAAALLLGLSEYAVMAFPGSSRTGFAVLSLMVLPSVAVFFLAPPSWMAVTLALTVMGAMVFVMLAPPSQDLSMGLQHLGRYVLGATWIGLLLPFLMMLRMLDDGVWFVFFAMCIAWSSDTGAYIVGRQWGRTKLYPRISPNKTWEGALGGVFAAVLTCFAIRSLVLHSLVWQDCVVLGSVGACMGVLGDLTESMVKRAYDVKDSGSIMPGHGGVLDRVDALMFVAPTVYGYLVLVKGV
jgi:phosphatidate cytidylyltransferase